MLRVRIKCCAKGVRRHLLQNDLRFIIAWHGYDSLCALNIGNANTIAFRHDRHTKVVSFISLSLSLSLYHVHLQGPITCAKDNVDRIREIIHFKRNGSNKRICGIERVAKVLNLTCAVAHDTSPVSTLPPTEPRAHSKLQV